MANIDPFTCMLIGAGILLAVYTGIYMHHGDVIWNEQVPKIAPHLCESNSYVLDNPLVRCIDPETHIQQAVYRCDVVDDNVVCKVW